MMQPSAKTTPLSSLVLLCMLGLVAPEARAQTVNTWVDDEGVTHFSDQRPAQGDAEVRQVEMPNAPLTEFESQDVNDRLNKALEQMEQDREAREQEAEARQRAKAADRALEREAIVGEQKKKKKDRDRAYEGPYPKPPPGPFPEKYPRLPSHLQNPAGSNNSANQGN